MYVYTAPGPTPMTPLVRDVLPEVYADLEVLVESSGDPGLSEQLQALTVTEACGCGDVFCASFYTGACPPRAWSDEGSHRTLYDANTVLVLAVDVVDSAIRYGEIISAETDAGKRVAKVLTGLGVGSL